MWRWSDYGRLPVIVDTTPCTYGFKTARPYLTAENQIFFDGMQILDSIEWICEEVLPRLHITEKFGKVVLHPVCSAKKLQLDSPLARIAQACSEEVMIPESAGCCAFAGDRGFLFPELTAAATKAEAAEVKDSNCHGWFSSSRTCEIAMTRATGWSYRSYLYMLHRATIGSIGEKESGV
jgi:D-lactate dehydrogenase